MWTDIDREKSKAAYQLRREGNLAEALKLATESKDQCAVGWVLYSYAKKALEEKNIPDATNYFKMLDRLDYDGMRDPEMLQENVKKLRQRLDPTTARLQELLRLSSDPEKISQAYHAASDLYGENKLHSTSHHENYGWIIYRFLKSEHCKSNPNFANNLFYFYAEGLKNPRPSLLHSQMMNLFLSYARNHSRQFNIIDFVEAWDLSSFRDEDYNEQEVDGKKYRSAVSRLGDSIIELFPSHDTLKTLYAKLNTDNLSLDVFRRPLFWKIHAAMQEKGMSHTAKKYFDWYKKNLCFGQSSDVHSSILLKALDFMDEKREALLPSFYFEWRKVPFRYKDMCPWTSQNGDVRISLLGKAARQVFKSLKNSKEQKAELYNSLYDDFVRISDYEDNEWFIRDKAKLCSIIGKNAEAHSLLLNFLKSHFTQAYAWSDLATYGTLPSITIKTALLCKALTLCREEKLSVGIILDLAEALIEEGLKERAKYELNRYRKICETNGFSVKKKAEQLISLLSGVNDTVSSNDDLYYERIRQAEEFIYDDVPWSTFVLIDQFKNKEERDRYVFANSIGESFHIGHNLLKGQKLLIGGVYKFKRDEEGHIFKADAVDAPKWSALEKRYGFINNIDTEKRCMWVTMPDGTARCNEYKDLSQGDAVEFYYYEKEIKGEKKGSAVGIHKTSPSKAYEAFHSTFAEITRIDRDRTPAVFFWADSDIYGRVECQDPEVLAGIEVGDCISVVYGKYTKNGKTRATTLKWESLGESVWKLQIL